MNKQNILEYLLTIFKTILVAIIIVLAVAWWMPKDVYDTEAKKEVQEETIDYYLIGVLIDKNKYLESKDPANYKINLKLGALYQIKKNYKEAEEQFKIADTKAPFGEFNPKLKLASLYIFQNKVNEAEEILNNLDERPDKKITKEKANLYNKIGEKYYNSGDYENAIPRFCKALFYYKIINDQEIKSVESSLASSYVYAAETDVSNLNIDEAIRSLKLALTIIDAPIIKYKLALLLMKDDPEQSSKYFEEVFSKEPSIINYETYHRFLSAIIAESEAQGDIAKAKLCGYKIKKLTEYHNKNILSINDVIIEKVKGKIKFNPWKNRYDIQFEFNVKNTSQHNINSLFLKVIFTDKNKNIVIDEINKQIIDEKSVLKLDSNGPTIHLRTSMLKDPGRNEPLQIGTQIFAAKTDSSYKVLIKEYTIRERIKTKQNWFKAFWQKLSHLF